MLIEPASLSQHLNEPGLRVLAVDQRGYIEGHIPGSISVSYEDFAVSRAGLSLELPNPTAAVNRLRKLGIGADTHLVLYGDTGAAVFRLWFTLDSLGMRGRTAILDGGWPRWRMSHFSIERGAGGEVKPAPQWSPCVNLAAAASFEGVKASSAAASRHDRGSSPRTVLVDARIPALYLGDTTQGGLPAGHIPGSVNLPFTVLFNSQRNSLITREGMQRVFREAGLGDGDRLIVYCHVGREASVVYFAARLLGYDVSLYDGSWEEWVERKAMLTP